MLTIITTDWCTLIASTVVVAAPCAGLAPKNVHIQTLGNADYHYNRL